MAEAAPLTRGRPIVVLGAGFAGAAAAWLLGRGGASCSVVHARAGASALYAGLIDGALSSAAAQEFALALGLVSSGAPRAVATREGVIRSVHGRDRALLDLDALAGRRIGVADVQRDDWDARLLVESFRASSWARRTRSEFVLVPLDVLRQGAERRIAACDFASLLDDPARLDALAAALRATQSNIEGWLFGPWLGVTSDAAAQLAALLSRPVGETTSPPGGVAGARFELRRDAALAAAGVSVLCARATQVRDAGDHVVVTLEDGTRSEARAVIFALGGVAGGGVELVRSRDGALRFALSLDAPLELWLDGEALDAGSSRWGPSFVRRGLSALERVGIACDAAGRIAGSARLFACGDVASDRPRTVSEAINAGIAVAKAALAT